MTVFSDKEKRLLRHFGIVESLFETKGIGCHSIYNLAFHEALIRTESGCYIESLRRVAKVLRDCSIYRMTPEFEALIQLEDCLDGRI